MDIMLFKLPDCPNCNMMEAIIDPVCRENGININRIMLGNENTKDMIKEYQLLTAPTIIIKKDNKIVEKVTKYISRKNFLDLINKYK